MLKFNFRFLFLIVFPLNIFGQTGNIDSGKYHPAKEVFEKDYKKQEYSKFSKNQIQIENNKVLLAGIKSIEFNDKSSETTKLILCNGFLDPYLISGSNNLKISIINELVLLNPNPQTKRYSFWIYTSVAENSFFINSLNPSEYYFELQNDDADENTSNADFINGAKLTFLKFGTIII